MEKSVLKQQWSYLMNYLQDRRLEISSNRAERSEKPFVIDRKNFLFANAPKGSTGSAIIFSMIQTILENQLDPYHYPSWLMTRINSLDRTDPQALQSLLPRKAHNICKTNIPAFEFSVGVFFYGFYAYDKLR